MKSSMEFINKFGSLIVFLNLIILLIAIFLNKFGLAEKIGNFFLVSSLLIFIVIFFRTKKKPLPKFKNINNRLLFFCISVVVLATIFIYKSIFLSGPAAWGDAPYFYPQAFNNFFAEPLVWESRGRLGIVNDLYWIYPLMSIYNIVGSYLGNDLAIRLLFYIPTLIFSFLGPWVFARHFGLSIIVRLFAAIVYTVNTYIILTIDGGQVGVALAYGLFPLTLLSLHLLTERKTLKQFFLTLAIFMFIIMADVRLAVIALLAFFIWTVLEFIVSSKKINPESIKIFLFFSVVSLGLSAYWLIPAFILDPTTGSGLRSDLKLISVLDPLFLHGPHWPFNEFGKVFPPHPVFMGIPLLIFASLFFKQKWYVLIFCVNFLIFVFFAKGDSGFLENIYAFLIDKVPLGGAFRDSTKFFAPILLYGGLLIGLTVENLQGLFKNKILSASIPLMPIIYLILLVYPALSGGMHGVLAARSFPKDMKIIADNISKESNFLRSVWFPERNIFSYHTEGSPALDAKSLINLRPLASLNVGTSDRFNFLHKEQFLEWLDIFGVKYLIFSGDTRRVLPNEEEDRNWIKLLNLAAESRGINKVELGTSFPIYQTTHHKPRIFAVDKMLAVLGGEDIYRKLTSDDKFSIGNQGFVFLEDGKFDPHILNNFSATSTILIFNQKSIQDFNLSFLSKFFISPLDNQESQWVLRSTGEYLKWKYELLVNNVETSEFDFGKGIAFSTKPNEELKFNINVLTKGEYILAIRYLSSTDSMPLDVSFANYHDEIKASNPNKFSWYTKALDLDPRKSDLVIKNQGGVQVVNVVAIIPKKEWEEASALSEKLISKYKLVDVDSNNFEFEASSLSRWYEINYEMISPVEYKVSLPDSANWLIFSDSYHPSWILGSETGKEKSQPAYSAINSFYLRDGLREGKLFFNEQKKISIGIYISLISLLIIISVPLLKLVLHRINLKE